jgi:8-oxo-dGTP pyrophosphatase MutT (NUDIX family)
MRVLLDSTSAPLSRMQFMPGHFTASAFIFSPGSSCALLIAHPTLGLWLQPGGHLEPGDESPLAAARREVLEETGLDDLRFGSDLFDVDVHEIPARRATPAHLHFDLRFVGIVEGLPAARGQEGVEARWIGLAELPTLASDESVRRMARKLELPGPCAP